MANGPGFFPHVYGIQGVGLTALATTTLDAALLTAIVGDVGAGTNGWTLFDDQRTLAVTPYWILSSVAYDSAGIAIGNGTTAITGSGNEVAFNHVWVAGTTLLRLGAAGNSNSAPSQPAAGAAAQFTVASVASDISAASNVNGSAATSAQGHNWFEDSCIGYVVLKYTAQNASERTFYVQLQLMRGGSQMLRIQVWDTWDAGTHVGTNGSWPRTVRAFVSRRAAGSAIEYVLWLLPKGVFGFWGGGVWTVTNTDNVSDFVYVGLLDQRGLAAVDTNAVIIAGTTNLWNYASTAAGLPEGTASILSHKRGGTWNYLAVPTLQTLASVTMWPGGAYYISQLGRAFVNRDGVVDLCEIDVIESTGITVNGSYFNTFFDPRCSRRGKARYLYYSAGNPSGTHLTSFGPTPADSNTYVSIRTQFGLSGHQCATQVAVDTVSSSSSASDFAVKYNHLGTSLQWGELNLGNGGQHIDMPRFFCMPTNL